MDTDVWAKAKVAALLASAARLFAGDIAAMQAALK